MPMQGGVVAVNAAPQAQAAVTTLSKGQLNDRSQAPTNAADASQNLADDCGGGVQIVAVIAGDAVSAVNADLATYVDLTNLSTPKAAYATAKVGGGTVSIVNGSVVFNASDDYAALAPGEVATVGTFTYVICMGNGVFRATTATVKRWARMTARSPLPTRARSPRTAR